MQDAQDTKPPPDILPPEGERRARPRRNADVYFNFHNADGSCKGLDDVYQRMDGWHQRMDRIEASLNANSSDTAEVLDIMRLGKSFFRIMGYFATFAKWAAGIAVAIGTVWFTFWGTHRAGK